MTEAVNLEPGPEEAGCHVMSPSADVDTEPVKWPIAPDGYIPNSVIRSWFWRRNRTCCWDDDLCHGLHREDEEDVISRILCSIEDEEEEVEEELTFQVKRKGEKKVEVDAKDSLRTAVNFLPPSREEDVELCEAITPPVQCPDMPSFTPEDHQTDVCEDLGGSRGQTSETQAEDVSVQGFPSEQAEVHQTVVEKTESPPPSPEHHTPQPESSPILLSAAKFDTIKDQGEFVLDQRILAIYKKFRASSKKSLPGRLSTTAEHHPTSKAVHCILQTKDWELSPNRGLDSRPPQATIHSTKDKRHKVSLQGFCSQRAARLPVTEHLVKPSGVTQPAAAIPSLQHGQAAAHQRVVQKIEMKDTLEPASCRFHHIIPMASQHNFFTLNSCGKTSYGRLQFHWMRGYGEGNMLVSSINPKYSAHKDCS